jgi:cytochrome c oxidase assembly factor CtaG
MTRRRGFRWWPNREQVLWSIGIAIALVVMISSGYDANWTGFGQSPVNDKQDPAKTLWDWLDLLIVPFVLALVGYLLTSGVRRAQRARICL